MKAVNWKLVKENQNLNTFFDQDDTSEEVKESKDS